LKPHGTWTALALVVLQGLPTPVVAQHPDQALLSTFCDVSNMQGSTCKKAKAYPGGRACDVKLGKERYSGRFLAPDRSFLVVRYDSDCEPHATNFGGSVVFEKIGGVWKFRSYQPGYQTNDCITIARNDSQERLICLTGHVGQGHLESGVAEILFTQDFSRDISLSLDFFITAQDSTGAYGSNTVACKGPPVYFGLSKLRAGPRPGTITVAIAYADKDTIATACQRGFPRPREIYGELKPGDAYVPPGYEKNQRFVIDLATRKVVAEAESGKTAAPR
jgi:hypothetical protein